jgi:DNA polymerase-3 subunit delta'
MPRAPAVQDVEQLPEADRLEGFPHPRETRILYGHENVEQQLAHAFAGQRMHHGLLLTGPKGIGKATLAYRLARYVLAQPQERESPEGSLSVAPGSPATRPVTALSHPGLLVVRRPYDPKSKRFAATIPVDEVRRLRSFLGHTAGENAWRVVIVDSADELNLVAANALLKSLEEPPQRALFILVCAEPSRLLATIRSRCLRVMLEPLGGESLRKAAGQALAAAEIASPDETAWARLAPLSQGSVRRALQLIGAGGLEVWEKTEAIFAGLPGVDWQAAHMLTDSLASTAQDQRFETFYALFLDRLAHLIRVRASGQGDRSDLLLARRLIAEGGQPAWAAAWQAMVEERADAYELNLDRKALILRALARLEALARA